jgi:hypothetical protein
LPEDPPSALLVCQLCPSWDVLSVMYITDSVGTTLLCVCLGKVKSEARSDQLITFAGFRVQRRLIHLSLSWADAVSHDCTAHAQRFLHSLSRISRRLVLHLGIELGSDQDDDDRKPDPDHEADSGT